MHENTVMPIRSQVIGDEAPLAVSRHPKRLMSLKTGRSTDAAWWQPGIRSSPGPMREAG